MGSAIFALALLSAEVFALPCEDAVKKNSQPLTFEMIEDDMPQDEAGPGLVTIPRKKLETFWFHTWPRLKEHTRTHGTTIGDLVEEYIEISQLMLEDDPDFSDVRAVSASTIGVAPVQLGFLRQLERLPLHAKMRGRDWYNVGHAYGAFMNLGLLAIALEPKYRERPSFHPLSGLTEKQVLKIMDSLENAFLDHVSRRIEIHRQQFDARRILGPRIRQALEPIIGRASSDSEINTPETQLALVLKNNMKLMSNFAYQLTNSPDYDYTITLDESVVHHSEHGDYESIHKLLRGLVGGDRFSTGVKTLFKIGPQIVQVRNILAGHKRLLGCLENNHLRVVKIDNVSDTHPIPAELCK